MKNLVIDTGPDFRTQALRAGIRTLDAVLYTHPHADHIHGIDDLRSYNFTQKKPIPVYCHPWTANELPIKFAYIFNNAYSEGGGIPQLELNPFKPEAPEIDVQGVKVIPLPLEHGSMQSVGYRISTFAYVVDCSYIPPTSMDRLRGLSVLVLDCVRLAPHRTHLNLEGALEVVNQLKPKKTYLTHLGHEFDYSKWMRKLPKGVSLAYDGLKLEFR